MNRLTLALVLPTLAFALAACGGSESSSDSNAQSAAPRGANFLLASAPEGAQSVSEAKSAVQEGDSVVVRGRIGGRMAPISGDSPVFLIVDLAIPHCGQMEDGCPTPWDYCCETPESLLTNSATVQLVDENGAPLDVDPLAAGLRNLDEVVVVGTVGPRPSQEVLTIRATAVHRTPGS